MPPLLHRHRLKRAVIVIGGLLMTGCGFDAVLKSPGPAAVTFVFGDTVLVLGSTVPLAVAVMAGGATQTHPSLIAFTDNPTVVGLTGGDDSLVAHRTGVTNLDLKFQSSLRAAAETVIAIRVRP